MSSLGDDSLCNSFHAKEAKMVIPFFSSNGQQFSWEEVCTAAELETDHSRIEERIGIAEGTLEGAIA